MVAISLWQPWASLVVHGLKQYETRSWSTKYRGELAIAASKSEGRKEDREECEEIYSFLRQDFPRVRQMDYPHFRYLPRGCVLGVVRLTDCIPTTSPSLRGISTMEAEMGNYEPGRFAWKLELVERFAEPIPCKGSQGLWEWEK